MTCVGLRVSGLRDMLQPSLIQPKDFDDILKRLRKRTGETKQNVIRFPTDEEHLNIYKLHIQNNEGTPMVFSKSGTKEDMIGTCRLRLPLTEKFLDITRR